MPGELFQAAALDLPSITRLLLEQGFEEMTGQSKPSFAKLQIKGALNCGQNGVLVPGIIILLHEIIVLLHDKTRM